MPTNNLSPNSPLKLRTILWTIFVAVSFIILSSTKVYAQKFRIDKVKGNKAVVTFTGGPIEPGKIYDFGNAGRGPAAYGGSRDKVVGISIFSGGADSARLSILSTSPGGSNETRLSLNGKYGFNKGQNEYGGLGGFSMVSGSGTSTTAFSIGGFFDYNMEQNRSGADKIMGFGGEAAFGSAQSGTSTVSFYGIYPNAFYKWFLLGPNTALRADAGLYYLNLSSSPSQTTSGLLGRLSFAHYF